MVAAYTLGILSLFTAVLPLCVPSPRVGKQQEGEGDEKKHGRALSKRREMLLVLMTSLFLFVYVGIESSYGGWIFT